MNISGFSPVSSAYVSTASRSSGGDASAATAKERAEEGRNGQLSREETAAVSELKQVDREVRQHEMAHMAAGGGMITSGASYTYQKGPDGVNYAVAGEVGIDTSAGRTPEETIARAQRIRSAALAPADPSGQDRAVAAKATQMEQAARVELAQQSQQAIRGESEEGDATQQKKLSGYLAAGKPAAGSSVNIYA